MEYWPQSSEVLAANGNERYAAKCLTGDTLLFNLCVTVIVIALVLLGPSLAGGGILVSFGLMGSIQKQSRSMRL